MCVYYDGVVLADHIPTDLGHFDVHWHGNGRCSCVCRRGLMTSLALYISFRVCSCIQTMHCVQLHTMKAGAARVCVTVRIRRESGRRRPGVSTDQACSQPPWSSNASHRSLPTSPRRGRVWMLSYPNLRMTLSLHLLSDRLCAKVTTLILANKFHHLLIPLSCDSQKGLLQRRHHGRTVSTNV
jgi:hypothetical protein